MGAEMTAPYTPDAVRTISRNAGKVPAALIADALGWPIDRLRRIAATHKIDIEPPEIQPAKDESPPPPAAVRLSLPDRRTRYFTTCLRDADAKILRAKAAERFTNPSRLLAEVFEGAVLRGKVDELATAAGHYRPGNGDEGA